MSGVSYAEKAGNVWKVTLDRAHAARFKRVFDGVAKFGHEVTISDTPRNAKDLLWFAERYPFDFDPYLHIVQQASLQDDREHAVATILDDSYKPSNPHLSLPLREYQARAVDLCLNTGAILLGDDVGLGKTATAIGLFARAEGLPAVVVTLTSLPLQWEREVKRFAPELRTHVILSGKPYPLNQTNKGKPLPLPDVILMSYSKLVTRSGDRSWAEVLAEKGYCKTLIFDEGQMLRNNDSERYRAARVLRDAATYCMLTTATPVYNYGGEIHNVIEIVQPGTLGTRTEFLREWCGREGSSESIEREGTGDMRKASVTDPVALGLHLRDCGVYLRRTRADVGRELPSLQRVFHYVEGDDSVKKIEDQIEKLCRTILEGTRDERFEAAGELDWKLRKATGLSKVMEAASFIRLLVEDGEKVLVYGWHHEVYDELMRILRDEKLDGGDLNPALYTGRETQRKKEIERARFMGGPTLAQAKVDYNDARLQETNVMLMSVRAGAGLDGLQFVCSTVVFVELDWSPGVHEQAEGRVYRDGQGLPVMVYYVVINEGSDPVVLDTLNLKTSQSEGIRNLRTDVETLQGADPNKMRALAERWLRDHGKI